MSIKKLNGYMTIKTKQRKTEKYTCKKCGKELTPQTAYFYVDGCNCAITENAPPYCKSCYIETYGRYQ